MRPEYKTGTFGADAVTLQIMTMLPMTSVLLQLPADTVVMVAQRDGYDLLVAVAAALIALTFLAVLLGLFFFFYQTRAAIRSVERMRRSLLEDPAVESVRKTVAHVEGISEVVREETTELTRSLGTVSERIRQATDRMEERIEEFNALMEVVQGEAEEVFKDTASTARGVRRGVHRLAEPRHRTRHRPTRDDDAPAGSSSHDTPSPATVPEGRADPAPPPEDSPDDPVVEPPSPGTGPRP